MFRKLKLFEIVILNFVVLFILSYVVHSYVMSTGFLYEVISIAFILVLIIFQTYIVFKRAKLLAVLYFIVALLILFLSVRVGGINGYFSIKAEGYSSYPTVRHGDLMLVEPTPANVMRGSFVAFIRDDGRLYAKRVHGMPGDAIRICNNLVYVNGYHYSLANNWFGQKADANDRCSSRQSSFTLQANEYFMLGDNLPGSIDSRHFGPIKTADIKGRALYKFGARFGVDSIFVDVSFQPQPSTLP